MVFKASTVHWDRHGPSDEHQREILAQDSGRSVPSLAANESHFKNSFCLAVGP